MDFTRIAFWGNKYNNYIKKDYDDGPRVQGLTRQTPIRPINESESDQLSKNPHYGPKELMDSKSV